MIKNIEFKKLISSDIAKYEDDLASLRLEVFREFPYLYEGDKEYEKKYLNRYIKAQNSLVILAID